MPATLWRHIFQQSWGLPWWLSGKESPADIGDAGSISGWKEPLEKEMATHSSILTCEPGRLQSMGSQKSDMTERLILPTHKLHFPSTPSFILSWVSSTNFFFSFDVGHLQSPHWTCYNIASVLCPDFLAARHVGSQLPDQGLKLHPLRWETKSQPLDCQRSPSSTDFNMIIFFFLM